MSACPWPCCSPATTPSSASTSTPRGSSGSAAARARSTTTTSRASSPRRTSTSPSPPTREEAHAGADFVIIATPTNYDRSTNYFDTSHRRARRCATCTAINPDATMVVKSTVPVGYIEDVRRRLGIDNVIFSPEFLREGQALHDNLHPSRIVVGEDSERARAFADLLRQGRRRRRRTRALHRAHRGRGDQAVRQHLPRDAGGLLQRARLLRDVPRPRHAARSSTASASTRGSARHYNNPSFGYGGLLPAQGHQAAARQLLRRAADADLRDRRRQHHPQGLHRLRHPRPQRRGSSASTG